MCKLNKRLKITDELIEEFRNSEAKRVQLKNISLGYTPISDRTIQETLCNQKLTLKRFGDIFFRKIDLRNENLHFKFEFKLLKKICFTEL